MTDEELDCMEELERENKIMREALENSAKRFSDNKHMDQSWSGWKMCAWAMADDCHQAFAKLKEGQ